MPSSKIFDLDSVGNMCRELKCSGQKVVLTSGCFDLLHPGHLEHLLEVSEFGCLVVGINSDQFVKQMKGPHRPLLKEQDRAFLMAGFFPVSVVTIFDDDYRLIDEVRPDIYVMSVTAHVRIYDDPPLVSFLNKLGIEIKEVYGPKVDSTTNIIQRAAVAAANSQCPI